MPRIDKKYIKVGVVALAVAALVIGLSVGLTQRNKNSKSSAAAGANEGFGVDSDVEPSVKPRNRVCVVGDSKSGKSGGKSGKSGGSGGAFFCKTSQGGGRRKLKPERELFPACRAGGKPCSDISQCNTKRCRCEAAQYLCAGTNPCSFFKLGRRNRGGNPRRLVMPGTEEFQGQDERGLATDDDAIGMAGAEADDAMSADDNYYVDGLDEEDESGDDYYDYYGELDELDEEDASRDTGLDNYANDSKSTRRIQQCRYDGGKCEVTVPGPFPGLSYGGKSGGKSGGSGYGFFGLSGSGAKCGKSGGGGKSGGKSGGKPDNKAMGGYGIFADEMSMSMPGCGDYCTCSPQGGKSGGKSGKSGGGSKCGKSGGDGSGSCTPTEAPDPTPAPSPCTCRLPTPCEPDPPTPTDADCICGQQPFRFDSDKCVRVFPCVPNPSFKTYSLVGCCDANFGEGSLVSETCNWEDICLPPALLPEPTYFPTTFEPTYPEPVVEAPEPTLEPSPGIAILTPEPTSGSTPTVSTEVTGPPTKGTRTSED